MIEPQFELKEYLESFCQEFDNSFYILAGAGAKKDVMIFTISPDLTGSSFLPKPDEKLQRFGKQREIEIITIDDLIDSYQIDPKKVQTLSHFIQK